MNVYVNFIHLPSFLTSGSPGQGMGELRNHVVSSLQVLSNYIRYNEATLGGSVLGINLGLVWLSEKTLSFASERFEGEFFKKPWVSQAASYLFKAVFVGVGISGVNYLMNLQLDEITLVASAIVSIALKVFWQRVLPEISCWWSGECKPEECKTKENSLPTASLDEILEDETPSPTALKGSDPVERSEPPTQQLEKNNEVGEEDKKEKLAKVVTPKGLSPRHAVPPLKTDLVKKGVESDEDEVLDDQLSVSTKIPSARSDSEEEYDSNETEDVPSGSTESMLESAPFFGALNVLDRFEKKAK